MRIRKLPIVVFLFICVRSNAQSKPDSCSMLLTIKAYVVEGRESDSSIQVKILPEGFNLSVSDSSYTITKFAFYYDDFKAPDGTGAFYAVYCEGGVVRPTDKNQFLKNINHATMLVVDRITVEKNRICYKLMPLYYKVIR